MIVCGWFTREVSDILPCSTTVVSHIGGHDDLLPPPIIFLCLLSASMFQFYGAVVEGVA